MGDVDINNYFLAFNLKFIFNFSYFTGKRTYDFDSDEEPLSASKRTYDFDSEDEEPLSSMTRPVNKESSASPAIMTKLDVMEKKMAQLSRTQQHILAGQEEDRRRWRSFQEEMKVRDQRQKDTLALLQNIYALMDQRSRAKDARALERRQRGPEATPARVGGIQTPRRPLADVQNRTPVVAPAAAAPVVAPNAPAREPVGPAEFHRVLSEDRQFILFPIRHEEEGPGNIYQPIRIPTGKFQDLKNKCTTPTNFARNLLVYFFDPETRRSSNFHGTRVITTEGPMQKQKLDRRITLTML